MAAERYHSFANRQPQSKLSPGTLANIRGEIPLKELAELFCCLSAVDGAALLGRRRVLPPRRYRGADWVERIVPPENGLAEGCIAKEQSVGSPSGASGSRRCSGGMERTEPRAWTWGSRGVYPRAHYRRNTQ